MFLRLRNRGLHLASLGCKLLEVLTSLLVLLAGDGSFSSIHEPSKTSPLDADKEVSLFLLYLPYKIARLPYMGIDLPLDFAE